MRTSNARNGLNADLEPSRTLRNWGDREGDGLPGRTTWAKITAAQAARSDSVQALIPVGIRACSWQPIRRARKGTLVRPGANSIGSGLDAASGIGGCRRPAATRRAPARLAQRDSSWNHPAAWSPSGVE